MAHVWVSRIKHRSTLFVAAGILILLFLELLGFFEGINHYSYDLLFRLRGARNPENNIIIAAIDEQTLKALGQWPIKREYYAKLIDITGQAQAVCIDIVFSEQTPDDEILSFSINRFGKVVLPLYISNNFKKITPNEMLNARVVGHSHVEPDIDGITRKVFHTLYVDKRPIRSMASILFEITTGKSFITEETGIHQSFPKSSPAKLFQRDPMRINYYGPPGTFPVISFLDIVSGRYNKDFFTHKIVFVGVTAPGIETEALTPFSQTRQRTPGVEVQATILANLLKNDRIIAVHDILIYLFSILGSFFCFLLFTNSSEKKGALYLLISVAFIPFLTIFLFLIFGIWFPPALFVLSIILVFAGSYISKLDESIRRLDMEYSRIISSLRWDHGYEIQPFQRKGLLAFLTSGGINHRIEMLARVTEQMIFEKGLVDATLASGVQGIVLFNSRGELIIANDKAKELFAHYTSDVMKNFEDFILALLPDAIGDEKPRDQVEFIKQTENALSLTIEISGPKRIFLKMDVGVITTYDDTYYLFVFNDITRIKELEIRKDEIVSIVTHELKQPLQIILGYSQLIPMDTMNKKDEYAQLINHEVIRMNKIISMFLDIARLESGKAVVSKTSVDLGSAISGAVDAIAPIARSKRAKILTDVQTGTLIALLDKNLLVQCLLNLIENAIKYGPPDNSVTVGLREEPAFIRITVSDKGFGIEPKDIPFIFDKFYRAKTKNNKEGVVGSGLGLAFVKEAVIAMGGNISVESEPDSGSTFTLTFKKESA